MCRGISMSWPFQEQPVITLGFTCVQQTMAPQLLLRRRFSFRFVEPGIFKIDMKNFILRSFSSINQRQRWIRSVRRMALWRSPALCKPRHLPKYAFAHLLLLSSSISSITYCHYHYLALNDYAEFFIISYSGELVQKRRVVAAKQNSCREAGQQTQPAHRAG